MANHEAKVEVYNGVSTEDVPSAGFGWSALSLRSVVTAGIVSAAFMLLMIHGNHHGNVENIWLIVLAALTLIGTAWLALDPKAKQRTTVSARNKAVGHQEPVWTQDQHDLTGVYANLTDEELLALNIRK